jgi:multicomponent Na+:H+ antiporter subunit D
MLENITILLLLPLILSQFCFLAKKHNSWFFVIQILISIICLESTIALGISPKIFTVDLGFFTLKFMCDIYSYFFGILVSVVWILTILYSHSYVNQEIRGKKITKFFYYISLIIFCTYGNAYSGNLETFFIFYFL